MANLLLHEIRSRRGAILGWGIGLGLFMVLIVLLFPQIADSFAGIELPEFYEMFGDINAIATLSGFMDLEFFSFFPLILAIYAILAGSGALAGEEDAGTLELILSFPIPRWQVVITKAIAIAITLSLILALTAAGAWVGYLLIAGGDADLNINGWQMARGILNLWFLLFLFAMLSFFFGSIMPSARVANVLAIIIMVEMYFLNSLGSLVEMLEPYQKYSPFYYLQAKDVMEKGLDAGNIAILFGFSLLLLIFTVLAFQRRNITVGAWPWQRARVPAGL